MNLRDPTSILAWLAVCPERHLPQLRVFWRLMPAFRESIEQAVAAHKGAKP